MTAVWCEGNQLGPQAADFRSRAWHTNDAGSRGHANFQFPRVWDLADPTGYDQQVILPRQNKAMARLLNKQLHDHATKEKRPDHRKTAGPTEVTATGQVDAPSSGLEEADKAGRAPRLALRTDPHKAGEAAKAYPAGETHLLGRRLPHRVSSKLLPQCSRAPP